MRRLLLWLLGIPLLIIVIAAAVLWALYDEEQLIRIAADQLEQRTGATLEVHGEGRLRFLPTLALQLEDAELTLPGEAPTRVRAEEMNLANQLLPLLKGQLGLDSLNIRRAEVHLPPAPGEPAGEPLMLSAFQASGINLAGEPTPISLTLQIPGEEPLTLNLEAQLTANADFQELQLASLQAVLQGDAPLVTLSDGSGRVRVSEQTATLKAERLQLQQHPLEQARLQLRLMPGDELRIESLTGTLHQGALDTRGSVWTGGEAPRITLRGSLQGISIDKLLAAMEVEAELQGSGDLQWQLATTGADTEALLQALDGTVDLASPSLTLREIGIHQLLCGVVARVNQEALTASFPADTVFSPLRATLRFRDGQMLLDPLEGSLEHIELRGDGRLAMASGDLRAELRARLSPGLGDTDPACRVNKRLTAIDWPVECRGQLGTEPKDWCRVDAESIVADLARNELEGKAREGAGRLLQRLLQRDDDGEDNP